jgi:hypothetical protein
MGLLGYFTEKSQPVTIFMLVGAMSILVFSLLGAGAVLAIRLLGAAKRPSEDISARGQNA